MAWRLARSLIVLRDEVDQEWPRRSKTSDGTLGDVAHASRPSDHNPNSAGVVRALDITASGIDALAYAERIRTLGAAGHRPLRNGGVVIFNRRIASSTGAWQWRPYRGVNPHVGHVHVSVGRSASEYDATDPWGVAAKEDELMPALSQAEQRELLDKVRGAEQQAAKAALLATSVDQRCERLEASIHGTNDENRGKSIWWRMHYFNGELLTGDNLQRLRNLLRSHSA